MLMTFCSKCGNEEMSDKNFCSKCGSELFANGKKTTITAKRRSNWWYILSIFIAPIGAIIAYFVIRGDDPEKAKNCLIIGAIIFVIGFVMGISIGS